MVEIITKEDLEQFRIRLLNDLKQIIAEAPNSAQKEWVKGIEVRKLLNLSPGTLQNLRIHRVLNPTKVGGQFYYRMSEINAVLEKGVRK